jgi:hypothetical protein
VAVRGHRRGEIAQRQRHVGVSVIDWAMR